MSPETNSGAVILMQNEQLYAMLQGANLELRESGTPAGIRNEGNSCYFSVILQSLFLNPKLCEAVLSVSDRQLSASGAPPCLLLLKNLRLLFARLCLLDSKFVSSRELIEELSRHYRLKLGDQQDLGEVYLVVTGALIEGLARVYGDKLFKQFWQGELQVFTAEVWQQDPVPKEPTLAKFSSLILSVASRDIYSALDGFFISPVEGTNKVQHSCITAPPDQLLIQLQRVVYSKETGLPHKDNSVFPVPPTLDLGRYTHPNRPTLLKFIRDTQKIDEALAGVRAKRALFQGLTFEGCTILQQLSSVRGLAANLLGVGKGLDQCSLFKGERKEDEVEGLCLGLSQLSRVQALLREQQRRIKGQIVDLQSMREKCLNKLPSLRYKLVATLIHKGRADSGHYYAYLRDYRSWRKFDDQTVKETSEEQVLLEAGGLGDASAYYLIYERGGTAAPDSRNFLLSAESHYGQDKLSRLVPTQLRDQMKRQNQQFHEQLLQQRSKLALVKFVLDYRSLLAQEKPNENYPPASEYTGLNPFHNARTLFGYRQDLLPQTLLAVLLSDILPLLDDPQLDSDKFIQQLNCLLLRLPKNEATLLDLQEARKLRILLVAAEKAARTCQNLFLALEQGDSLQALLSCAYLQPQLQILTQVNKGLYRFARSLKEEVVQKSLASKNQQEERLAASFIKRHMKEGRHLLRGSRYADWSLISQSQIVQACSQPLQAKLPRSSGPDPLRQWLQAQQIRLRRVR